MIKRQLQRPGAVDTRINLSTYQYTCNHYLVACTVLPGQVIMDYLLVWQIELTNGFTIIKPEESPNERAYSANIML